MFDKIFVIYCSPSSFPLIFVIPAEAGISRREAVNRILGYIEGDPGSTLRQGFGRHASPG